VTPSHAVDTSVANHAEPLLEVDSLSVGYTRRGRLLDVLREVSFSIRSGQAYGLVGESGCGKSTVAMALMSYLAENAKVTGGRVGFQGEDLLEASHSSLRSVRGNKLAMVYQEVGSSLNPSMRIGPQVAEVYRYHSAMGRKEAHEAALKMLARVQLSDPEAIAGRYPHQLSGGQQQRVSIAMALATDPALLVMDEPTTGLDATVEAEVLDLVQTLRAELNTAILLISHNLGVVARVCDRVGVLYAGKIIEEGDAQEVLNSPRHPYTLGLVRCVPRSDMRKHSRRLEPIKGSLPAPGAQLHPCLYFDRCPIAQPRCDAEAPQLLPIGDGHTVRCHFHERVPDIAAAPETVNTPAPAEPGPTLLEVKDVRKTYKTRDGELGAVAGVTLDVRKGEVLGIVGESGSGKSSLAKCLVGLVDVSDGEITFDGATVSAGSRSRHREMRRALQMVFQDPDTALNPRRTVKGVLQRSLRRLGGQTAQARNATVLDLAGQVRLEERHLSARPQALSGGLKQRVAIAAAFAGAPELVVCDEPVSALDVSVQAAILNLLADLQARQGVSYVLISHDLGVVRYLSDRIAVMYLGQIVETGPAERVFSPPHHPYTEALASAIPRLETGPTRSRIRLSGAIPSAASPPAGCRFHTRCHRCLGEICRTQEPPWQQTAEGHAYRCHIDPATLRADQEQRLISSDKTARRGSV
jgi:peptide/nickel transport system ATP-binding protein